MTSADDPATRFIRAQRWWIASELVSRHPDLFVVETKAGGGIFDCFSLVRPQGDGMELFAELVSNGRIHSATNPDHEPVTWRQTMDAPDGLDTVRALEKATGLGEPTIVSSTAGKVLTYRVLARVLGSLVNDRHAWDARYGMEDWFDRRSERRELDRFSSIDLDHFRQGDPFGRMSYRLWILFRDEEPVAVLDIDGQLHQQDRPPVDLSEVHRQSGSSLTATVGTSMGHLLP